MTNLAIFEYQMVAEMRLQDGDKIQVNGGSDDYHRNHITFGDDGYISKPLQRVHLKMTLANL